MLTPSLTSSAPRRFSSPEIRRPATEPRPEAPPCAWPTWLFPGLDRLDAAPGVLLFVMLALNSLVQPYHGFEHDARLYAVQAVERVQPGLYGDDLYLRYGSQDRYSAFSLIVMPLIAAIGATATFFLVY